MLSSYQKLYIEGATDEFLLPVLTFLSLLSLSLPHSLHSLLIWLAYSHNPNHMVMLAKNQNPNIANLIPSTWIILFDNTLLVSLCPKLVV